MTPRSRVKCCGDRAFSVCAPKLWKNLPENIKRSPNLTSYLFSAILVCSFAFVFEFIIY